MTALSDIEIRRELASLPGWSHRANAIGKRYHFANFLDGIAFVGKVAGIAEELAHHPDIDIRYTTVHFSLSTHDAGGVTPKDMTLARRIEALV